MTTQNTEPLKFKPERPIFLHESNTGFKTAIEVQEAVEKLRLRHWLCAYSEKVRPFHMSFNNETQLRDFKKDCKDLGIVLKSPVISSDDIEALEEEDKKGVKVEGANDKSTYEGTDGRVHKIK